MNNKAETKLKSSLLKIGSLLKNTLLALMILVSSILAFHGIKVNTEEDFIPSVLNYSYLNVLSGSMSPEFAANDAIFGKKVSEETNLSVGDIITFKDENLLVTHRVVEILDNGKAFKTKGDANSSIDKKIINKENIVSVVKFVIPKGGYVIAKFQNLTFLFLLWLIVLYYIFSELYAEYKKSKANKKLNISEIEIIN